MEQTVAFINEVFAKQGDFSSQATGAATQSYEQFESRKYEQQSVMLSAPCQLTYHLVQTTIERQTQYDKKHRPLIPDKVTNTTVADVIRLDRTNPVSLAISPFSEGWSVNFVTLFISQEAHFADTEKIPQTLMIGTFTDRSLADRAAKAYIHIMAGCYKPEAKPLF
jgi:hypothetical protein